jgi:hypothetical protein
MPQFGRGGPQLPAEEPEADKAPDDFHPMRVRPYVAADGIGQPTAQTSVPRPQDLVFFQDEPPPEATDGTSPRQVRQAQYMALRAIGFVAVAALTLTGTIIAIVDKSEVRTESASQHTPPSFRISSADAGLVPQLSPTASPSSATGPAAEVKPDTAGSVLPGQRNVVATNATTGITAASAAAKPSKTSEAQNPSTPSTTKPATGPGRGSSPPEQTTHSLRSVNYPDRYVRVRDSLGYLDRVSGGAQQQASFSIVGGLADASCVSFRTSGGQYLRHYRFRIHTADADGSRQFREDATFCQRKGAVKGSVSYESYNYPGRYLRHRDFQLWVDPYQNTRLFQADSSFTITGPLA